MGMMQRAMEARAKGGGERQAAPSGDGFFGNMIARLVSSPDFQQMVQQKQAAPNQQAQGMGLLTQAAPNQQAAQVAAPNQQAQGMGLLTQAAPNQQAQGMGMGGGLFEQAAARLQGQGQGAGMGMGMGGGLLTQAVSRLQGQSMAGAPNLFPTMNDRVQRFRSAVGRDPQSMQELQTFMASVR